MSVTETWVCSCGRENPTFRSLCQACRRQAPELEPLAGPGAGRDGRAGVAHTETATRLEMSPVAKGVAGALVLLVLVAVVAPRARDRLSKKERVVQSAAVPGYATLKDVVRTLEAYVERARGLKFKAPVKVTVLDDRPFVDRLRSSSSPSTTELRDEQTTLRALDMIGPDVDLAKQDEQSFDAVVGFYDPKAKELYVRGTDTSPYVRFVLVHELTHALQDQNLGLRLATSDSDSALASRTVPEGDAERVTRGYVSTLSLAEQDALQQQAVQRKDDLYGQAFGVSFANFPYVVGKRFVNGLLAAGGQERLDAAFRVPPASTEQVISPGHFLARDMPRPVPEPSAGGPIVDRGVIGEFQLIYLLASSMDEGAAVDAALGWGGSRYVSWKDGRRSCTRAVFVMDTPGDAAQLSGALRQWAAGHGGATLSGTGPTTLMSCR